MSLKLFRYNTSNYPQFNDILHYQYHFNSKCINHKSHFMTSFKFKITEKNLKLRDFKTKYKLNITKNSDDRKTSSSGNKIKSDENKIKSLNTLYIESMYKLPLFENMVIKKYEFKKTLISSITIFALVTYDIFFGNNIISKLDISVEKWVYQNIPSTIQLNFFDEFISNLVLILPLVTWFSLNLIHIKRAIKKSNIQIIIKNVIRDGEMAMIIGSSLIGSVILKNLLKRERPRVILLSSFSFPSIHTFMAVLLTGLLLYIKLPQVLRINNNLYLKIQKNSNYIWILSGVITAFGRVFSNSHWLSDTVAGASLGVSVTVIIIIMFKNRHSCDFD